MMKLVLPFSATLLAILCFAPGLRAQDEGPPLSDAVLPPGDAALPPPPASPTEPEADEYAWVELREPRVRVKLTGGDPRLKFRVYSHASGANRKLAIFVCQNPCQVLLPRGEYRVHVSGGPEHAEGERVIDVAEATSFSFSLPDRSAKNAGLGIAIAGTTLLPVGLFTMFMSIWGNDCYECSADERRKREAPAGIYIGLGMVAVGAVLTPVGWVMFGSNRKPGVREGRLAERREGRAPRVGVGATPVPGGAAAGVWGAF